MKIKNAISFEISSDFGFFKKPDINDTFLTYNIIPIPTLLGLFGAIIGLKGYLNQYLHKKNSRPEFYEEAKGLIIGLKPIGNFPFDKIFNVYNNSTGVSQEKGGNLIIKEQLLIKPSYKIFLGLKENSSKELINYFNKLKNNIKKKISIFTPYMGKNDFPVFINNLKELNNISSINSNETFIKISSCFFSEGKNHSHKLLIQDLFTSVRKEENSEQYTVLENYPYKLNDQGQYEFILLKFSNKLIRKDEIISYKDRLFKIENEVIYFYEIL